MNPDCQYCGFKDDKPHECFPEKAIARIDEVIADYHVEWLRAQDTETKLTATEAVLVVKNAEVERLRSALRGARAAMKQHDEAPYQCESTTGAAGGMRCVSILDDALTADNKESGS